MLCSIFFFLVFFLVSVFVFRVFSLRGSCAGVGWGQRKDRTSHSNATYLKLLPHFHLVFFPGSTAWWKLQNRIPFSRWESINRQVTGVILDI